MLISVCNNLWNECNAILLYEQLLKIWVTNENSQTNKNSQTVLHRSRFHPRPTWSCTQQQQHGQLTKSKRSSIETWLIKCIGLELWASYQYSTSTVDHDSEWKHTDIVILAASLPPPPNIGRFWFKLTVTVTICLITYVRWIHKNRIKSYNVDTAMRKTQ